MESTARHGTFSFNNCYGLFNVIQNRLKMVPTCAHKHVVMSTLLHLILSLNVRVFCCLVYKTRTQVVHSHGFVFRVFL